MKNELKTLNDLICLNNECPDCSSIHHEDLRKEMIKWIKALDENREQWKYDKEHTNKLIDEMCDYNEDGAINVLMHIFNIKQEEINGKN